MQRSLRETRRMEKKKRGKKTPRWPGTVNVGEWNGARGFDNHPIQETCKSKWTDTDARARARASSGLNLVSDYSPVVSSPDENAVHRSHVSPIRVGPHFHLHLYSGEARRPAELNPPWSRNPHRRAGVRIKRQIVNGEHIVAAHRSRADLPMEIRDLASWNAL